MFENSIEVLWIKCLRVKGVGWENKWLRFCIISPEASWSLGRDTDAMRRKYLKLQNIMWCESKGIIKISLPGWCAWEVVMVHFLRLSPGWKNE